VASGFALDGSMIPRTEQRRIDERQESRHPSVSNTAVLEFRGRRHVVQLINVSKSGAMIVFPHVPNIGERLSVQLIDHGIVWAQVRWVKDGRVGLSFASPLE
jgi:PilZ domain